MRTDSEAAVIQNLKDAGCDDTTIASFLADWRGGKIAEGVRTLKKHRRALLTAVHAGQKRIDCLDYLIYHIDKTHTDRGGKR